MRKKYVNCSIVFNISTWAFNAFRFPQLLEWKTRAVRTKYKPASWSRSPPIEAGSLEWARGGFLWVGALWKNGDPPAAVSISCSLPICLRNVFLLAWPRVFWTGCHIVLVLRIWHKTETTGISISGSKSRKKEVRACILYHSLVCAPITDRPPQPPTPPLPWSLLVCRKNTITFPCSVLAEGVDHLIWWKETT